MPLFVVAWASRSSATLARQEEVLTYQVDAHLFAACALDGKALLATLEAGELPDLEALTRTFGTAIEFVLCDLFSQHGAASGYWVDGVIIDAVTLQPSRMVNAKGRAWCADHQDPHEQWQIPVEIVARFSNDQESNLVSVVIRVGNAAMATLGGQHSREDPSVRRRPRKSSSWQMLLLSERAVRSHVTVV